MLKDKFLNYLKAEKRCSVHTLSAYRTDLDQFFVYSGISGDNVNEILEVNNFTVRGWLSSLIEQGTSARSVNRKSASLNSFFKYLMRNGIVQTNPVVSVVKPKVKKTLPKFLDQEKLVSHLDTAIQGDSYEEIRDKTIIELLYATGIRVSELVNIRMKDVDFSLGEIKILGKRNKERYIPLTPLITDKLKGFIAARSNEFPESVCNFLFLLSKGTEMQREKVYSIVRKELTIAGFTGKRSPHVLRHTFATHLLNNGADLNSVKDLLGHSSLAATQVYTHNTFEQLIKVYNQAHPHAKEDGNK